MRIVAQKQRNIMCKVHREQITFCIIVAQLLAAGSGVVELRAARARRVTHGFTHACVVGKSERTRWILNRGDRGRWPQAARGWLPSHDGFDQVSGGRRSWKLVCWDPGRSLSLFATKKNKAHVPI